MPRKMRQSGVDWIGEIPEGWKVCRLKHVADIIMGQSPSAEDIKDSGKTPFMQGNREFGLRYPNPSLYCESCSKHSRVGDVLMSVRAPVGAVNISDRVYAIGRGLCSIKAVGIEREYLEFFIRKSSQDFLVDSNGSTFEAITTASLLNFPVIIPSLAEQRAIASFLSSQCSEIDGLITDTKVSIEDYKVLKKTLVFEAVTGKNLKGKKVASGQDWLGEIPAAWDVRRIVNLYREVSERGDDSLPILSVSINTGVSDKELSDEEQERVFIRSEDKTKYKRVQPGDLTYNMMRAWQGAFGAVRVNGMVSPAYVVARPKVEMDSRYVEYLLRSPNATREMQRYSRGIADFRLRLYWPEFKNIRIPCPPLEEQKRIADMLDEKCGEIDAVIADKERLIADLETYKKSLIFEVVTGKREVA